MEWSADPFEIPLGPIIRDSAKRFKKALNVLIQNAHVEGVLTCSIHKKKQRWFTSSK